MGFLDSELCPHLGAVTEAFRTNQMMWLSMVESRNNSVLNSAEAEKLKRQRLNLAAEAFRVHGNALFQAQDFTQALRLYTESIAAAIEGPLASLAYFNRYFFLFLCDKTIFMLLFILYRN